MNNTTRAFGSPHTYIQGPGEFDNVEKHTSHLGKNVCFLIDGFLFQGLNERLKQIYKDTNSKFIAINFQGECCESEINRINEIAKVNKVDLFVGVGGGKTMDTAKLCADKLNIPFAIVPTSVSTDAPVSQIAVIYSEEGEHLGSRKIKRNSEFVLVDSEIVIGAPKRLFVAGIGDALATWFEAKASKASNSPNYVGSGYRRCLAGMAIAKMCYDTVLTDGINAIHSLEKGEITESVENIIEANTLLSGLGFHNTGLSAAHGIHSGLTAVPSTHKYLHGEKVAFGLVCQMVLENTPTEEIDKLMKFMTYIGLPVTLDQLDVEVTQENVSMIARKTTMDNKLIYAEPMKITEQLVYNAIIEADELGKTYLK
ncbi:MAG: glycerol dehydrogenase [Thermotaleaceae bacterium]